MADYFEVELESITPSIISDNLSAIWTKIINLLTNSTDMPEIGKTILRIAVTHHSHKVTKFVIERYPCLLSDHVEFRAEIFHLAIDRCNDYGIELLLNNDLELNRNLHQYFFDQLIDRANQILVGLRTSQPNSQAVNIIRLKKIMKHLLEYPLNQYNQHGIVLEYNEAAFDFTVSSNDNLDINQPIINNQTLLGIWINRKNETVTNGRRSSEYIQNIVIRIIIYLIKHVAKMQSMKIFVSRNNLLAISTNAEYQKIKADCDAEIRIMFQLGVVTDRFVSVFEVFTANQATLAQFSINKTIRQYILSDACIRMLPMYGQDIADSIIKSINNQANSLDEL